MDFSEIIIAIIVGLVILAINSSGSKKKQATKNQSGRPHNHVPEPREYTRQKTEESIWDIPQPLSLDDIFAELRKAKEETERANEDYIPRSPQKKKPVVPRKPVKERREPAIPEPLPQNITTPASTQAVAETPRPATQPLKYEETTDEQHASIDIQDVDWRKAVIVSEILNRKY